MSALELLAEVHRRGVAIEVEGGHLRLSPASALSTDLIGELRVHKSKLLELLESRPNTDFDKVLPQGFSEEQPTLRTDGVTSMSLAEFSRAHLVVEVCSEVLQESVVFASDNATVDSGEQRVVYRARELSLLLSLGADELRSLHAAKKIFGATLEVS
ncbi:MAG: hypothetical protein K0U98_05935 [Deltaproteobacteria bacterium]|nr:hypothetical protein [Deltaproteobacteria bacterium]